VVTLFAAAGLWTGSANVSEAAVVSSTVLKSFFQTGDFPTQSQFGALIDSLINRIDDRHLLGLKQYNPTLGYEVGDCLTEGTLLDASMTFGPAAGLGDVWAGQHGFLGLAFTEGSSSDVHYGYLQIQAAATPDGYPMFVEAFVYQDVAGMAITTLTVPTPEPSTLAMAIIGLLGLFAVMRRRRTGK